MTAESDHNQVMHDLVALLLMLVCLTLIFHFIGNLCTKNRPL